MCLGKWWYFSVSFVLPKCGEVHTHTHTYTHVYIYIYIHSEYRWLLALIGYTSRERWGARSHDNCSNALLIRLVSNRTSPPAVSLISDWNWGFTCWPINCSTIRAGCNSLECRLALNTYAVYWPWRCFESWLIWLRSLLYGLLSPPVSRACCLQRISCIGLH